MNLRRVVTRLRAVVREAAAQERARRERVTFTSPTEFRLSVDLEPVAPPCEFCAFGPVEAFEELRRRSLVSMRVFTCAACAEMLGRPQRERAMA